MGATVSVFPAHAGVLLYIYRDRFLVRRLPRTSGVLLTHRKRKGRLNRLPRARGAATPIGVAACQSPPPSAVGI
jgi:hypothetical protein